MEKYLLNQLNEISPYALELIIKERHRQIHEEHWSLDHDKRHKKGQLACASAHYAIPEHIQITPNLFPPNWDPDHDLKSSMTRIEQLIASGCFILSEIDRLISEEKENSNA